MDDLINLLLSVGLVALGAFVIRSLPLKYRFNKRLRRSSRDMKELIEEAFAERPFKLPHGAVPRANLILIAKRAAPASQRETFRPGDEGEGPTWFYMGPGPSYVIARAVFEIEWHGHPRIEFAILQPDADRFRQLLGGDEAALDMLERVERAMGHGAVVEKRVHPSGGW